MIRLILLLVLAGLLAAACSESGVVRTDDVPTPPDETENVFIVGEDDVILNGRLFGSRNEIGVVLSHMRPNDQTAWFDYAEQLADAGYAALTFDFRGYGESGGEQDFALLDEDLTSAIAFLSRDREKSQVFLIGASMGGTTSLVVAAERGVDGVVSISSPARFEDQDALAAVPRVTAPKLFLASEGDEAARLSLEELFEATGQPKEQQVYTGNAHGTNLLDSMQSEHAAAVRARILRFLDEHRAR
jgi:alpha-beta hydrolase superfamily lysophospholipase